MLYYWQHQGDYFKHIKLWESKLIATFFYQNKMYHFIASFFVKIKEKRKHDIFELPCYILLPLLETLGLKDLVYHGWWASHLRIVWLALLEWATLDWLYSNDSKALKLVSSCTLLAQSKPKPTNWAPFLSPLKNYWNYLTLSLSAVHLIQAQSTFLIQQHLALWKTLACL